MAATNKQVLEFLESFNYAWKSKTLHIETNMHGNDPQDHADIVGFKIIEDDPIDIKTWSVLLFFDTGIIETQSTVFYHELDIITQLEVCDCIANGIMRGGMSWVE